MCGNIATFTILTLVRKVYGFSPPKIEHVSDNQSAITATWKDENISVFDKTKPDDGAAKVAATLLLIYKTFLQSNPTGSKFTLTNSALRSP
jgi:hypothetical protein